MNEQLIGLLRAQALGEVVVPGGATFAKASSIWNSRLQGVPGAILRCEGEGDVSMAINLARQHQVPVTVRSGGHSYAGLSSLRGGLVIDLTPLQKVQVDPVAQRALVGPGSRWGHVCEETLRHGLATTTGTVTTVGIGGYTLGGGTGWLARLHGLSLDNLVAAEIVTADAEIRSVNESRHPDLFWAVRGGAGNFGVVTEMEFQLHQIPQQVFAGQAIFPFSEARRGFELYREVMPSLPDAFTCYPAIIRIPPVPAFPEVWHGQLGFAYILCHVGDTVEGEALARPFLDLGQPILKSVGPRSYLEVQKFFDAGVPDGQRWFSRAHYLDALSDGAISTILEHVIHMPGAFSFVYLEPLGGAIALVPPEATAFPHRKAAYGFHILAGWPEAAEDAAALEWTRKFHDAMEPHANGSVYVNLLAEDEADRIPSAYGSNYERLRKIKAKWDPDNLFRRNQNIPPK